MRYYISYCCEKSWLAKKNENIAPPTIIKNYDLQKIECIIFFVVISNYSL